MQKKLIIDANGIDTLRLVEDALWMDIDIIYGDRNFVATVNLDINQIKRLHEFLGEWLDDKEDLD